MANRNGAATLNETYSRQAGEPPACFAFEGFTDSLFASGSFTSGGFAFGGMKPPTPIAESWRDRFNLMLFNRILTEEEVAAGDNRLNLIRFNLNGW